MTSAWICRIPFEPHRKRAHTAAWNPKLKRPYIVDPDRDQKADWSTFIAQHCELPPEPFSGPLEMTVVYRFELPKSLSKKEATRRMQCQWAAEERKDLDNLNKFTQDVLQFGELTGKVFADDHWICRLVNEKVWSESYGIEITLRRLSDRTSLTHAVELF